MATIVTGSGQVIIPPEVRAHLGISPGDRVNFDVDGEGRTVLTKAGERPQFDRFERARGSAGPGPTTDEIMALLRADP